MRRRRDRDGRSKDWQDGVWQMNERLGKDGIRTAVMEIYSPSRINGINERMGITPGLSLDLTTNDPDDGNPWDFNDEEKNKNPIGVFSRVIQSPLRLKSVKDVTSGGVANKAPLIITSCQIVSRGQTNTLILYKINKIWKA